MNLTCFHHKKRVKYGKQKQQPSQHQISCRNIRLLAETSDIRSLSENNRSDVKTSEVAALSKTPSTVT